MDFVEGRQLRRLYSSLSNPMTHRSLYVYSHHLSEVDLVSVAGSTLGKNVDTSKSRSLRGSLKARRLYALASFVTCRAN